MKARLIDSEPSGAAEGGEIITVGFDCIRCLKSTDTVRHIINEVSPENKIYAACKHCGCYNEMEGLE